MCPTVVLLRDIVVVSWRYNQTPTAPPSSYRDLRRSSRKRMKWVRNWNLLQFESLFVYRVCKTFTTVFKNSLFPWQLEENPLTDEVQMFSICFWRRLRYKSGWGKNTAPPRPPGGAQIDWLKLLITVMQIFQKFLQWLQGISFLLLLYIFFSTFTVTATSSIPHRHHSCKRMDQWRLPVVRKAQRYNEAPLVSIQCSLRVTLN